MNFDLDENQRAFQQAVADYLTAECPLARAMTPHDTGKADLGIWRGLMELGIGRMMVPEEHGGLGLGLLDLAVVTEPIGRFAAPGPFLDHTLATIAILLAGSAEQRARWLPGLASGELRGTVALAEGKGRWLADDWQFPAGSTITGSKSHVGHAEGADVVIVGLEDGRLGIVAGDAAGVEAARIPSTDAGRTLFRLSFDDAPCELLEVAAGARLVDAGLVLAAADAFGGASRCLEMAVGYSKDREQFGQPIGAFQAVKHQLADMALAVEPAIGLYWYAAHVFDAEPEAAPLAAALAKAHITEMYPRIARRMIEAHGGIGYTWEFGAHVWLKRALHDQAWLGMPRVHRARAATLAGW